MDDDVARDSYDDERLARQISLVNLNISVPVNPAVATMVLPDGSVAPPQRD